MTYPILPFKPATGFTEIFGIVGFLNVTGHGGLAKDE